MDEQSYSIQRNVFVVGFGKAVLGMARVLEDLLGQHIIKGILSIPAGARADFEKAGKKSVLCFLKKFVYRRTPDERSPFFKASS